MRTLLLALITCCSATAALANPMLPTPVQLQAGTSATNRGIPSRMKAGASTQVAVTLKNTGSRSWSSTGSSPVRLVVRWVNTATNSRSSWSVHWLGKTVEPGQSADVAFPLKAPSRSGKYTLTYALVRLNGQVYDGKKYTPPPSNAQDHRWPGEFGAVDFEIQVTP
jgi:hypothetical protein